MSGWRQHNGVVRNGRRLVAVAAIGSALVLAGCGSGDDPDVTGASAVSGGEPAETRSEDAGDAATTVTAVGDAGIPLHPSAEAVSTTESGPITVVQYIVPIGEQAEAIAFYDEWTANQAAVYERIEADSGGVSWQTAPDPGGERHLIAVLSPLEGDDFVTVTLTVGALE